MKMLLKSGSSVNGQSDEGQIPLHLSAQHGHYDVVSDSDRATERQRDRASERQRDRARERQSDRGTERKSDREKERQRDRATERERDRATERKSDRVTERQSVCHSQIQIIIRNILTIQGRLTTGYEVFY